MTLDSCAPCYINSSSSSVELEQMSYIGIGSDLVSGWRKPYRLFIDHTASIRLFSVRPTPTKCSVIKLVEVLTNLSPAGWNGALGIGEFVH